MKQLDKEKFQKMLERARVQFGLKYWGKSNNMRVGCTWNDRQVDLGAMTDEQVVLLWQLLNSALGMLTEEQIRRGLLPEEIAKMYRDAAQVKSELSEQRE